MSPVVHQRRLRCPLGDLSQYLFSGLSVGCIYALVALGFVVIANVSGVYNFAQGDYVMAGGMIMAWGGREGWNTTLSVALSVVVVAAVAAFQERVTLAPVRGRVGALGMVVSTLGFGLVLQGLALRIWKEDPLRAAAFTPGVFEFLGARLANQVLWVWATTAAALAVIVALFRLTCWAGPCGPVPSTPLSPACRGSAWAACRSSPSSWPGP